MLDETLPSGGDQPYARFAGRYRIERPLGRGASKQVYLAHDERLDRRVALALFEDSRARARIEREMRLTGRLGEHPNVVTIYDAGEHEGLLYLVLRPMLGGSLAGLLVRGRVEPARAARLGAELAAALAHAHAHGVVHRDVKPGNVWLTEDGRAALGDFGVASEGPLAAGRPVGTALYVAPEVIRGDEAGPAADLYSLGATLYELLCGRPPFAGTDAAGVFAQHLDAAPVAPSATVPGVPPALDALVLALLAKEPEDRPPSAAAVGEALSASVADRGLLVGRDDVVARLRAAWDDAARGRRRVVVLGGEAGLGKSRLAEELAAYASGTVARGLCLEDEGAPPYRPWAQVAARLLGDRSPGAALERLLSSTTDAGEEGRLELFDAVVELLVAEAPVLAILEDLHWADRSSLELLAHVVRELPDASVMLLATSRDVGGQSRPALRDALGQIAGRPGCETVELAPLGEADLARWLEVVGANAVPGELLRRTGGNPLFAAELVRALGPGGELPAEIPGGVRAVVGRRVAALPEDTVDLLRMAAVAGTEFAPAVVARACGVDRLDALERLEAAEAEHLVLNGEAPVRRRFAHALVREVVYAEQPAPARARRHARIAAVLEEDPSQAEDLARHHLEAARAGADPEPALEWSLTAARSSARVFAFAEAAGHLQRALEAAELAGAPGSRRVELLLELARARADAGDLDDSRSAFEQAAAVARRLEDPEPFARAALGASAWQAYGAIDRSAIALLEEARSRLGEGDRAVRAQVLGRLGVRLDRAELLDEAVAMARRLGDRGVLARLLAVSPLVHRRPEEVERRRADTAETIELAQSAGDVEAALWARIIRIVDHLATGAIAALESELREYEASAAELRRPYYRWYGMVLRAGESIFLGRLEEGERWSAEAVALNREHEADAEQEHLVQQAALSLARGTPEGADLGALRGLAERYVTMPAWRALVARLEFERGDDAAARDSLALCRRAGGADPDAICTATLLADVAAGLGDRATCELALRGARALRGPQRGVRQGLGRVRRGARALGLLSEGERAAAHLRRARELHAAWGVPLLSGRAARTAPSTSGGAGSAEGGRPG
jgi:hypothetical protein